MPSIKRGEIVTEEMVRMSEEDDFIRERAPFREHFLNRSFGVRGKAHVSGVTIKLLFQGVMLSPSTFLFLTTAWTRNAHRLQEKQEKKKRKRKGMIFSQSTIAEEALASVMKHVRVITKLNCPSLRLPFCFLYHLL